MSWANSGCISDGGRGAALRLGGLGLAFLSLHIVHREIKDGYLVAPKGHGLPVMRHGYLVHSLEAPLDKAARRVAEAIDAMSGGFLPKVITG